MKWMKCGPAEVRTLDSVCCQMSSQLRECTRLSTWNEIAFFLPSQNSRRF